MPLTDKGKVTIHIDGQPYQVTQGINLLEACLDLQLDLPYFCWHPAMGSAGACRQCAMVQYQNAQDDRGRLVMACMTPTTEGMILSLTGQRASEFRATTIEAIMTNHPHDCPVCEEGGDCHLQDMTLLSGHIKRRYPGQKRTHLNQYLGPFLNHEMNRCIGCYRCVRFYRDYCGGDDLNVFASRNNVFFGRAQPGILENEFSGNLVEVCPTGVFTDKPFSQQYSRKWDLQSAPTICVNCSVGCNTYTSERSAVVRKVANRFHNDINGHFLCDRGRYGYEHCNHQDKLDQPLFRNTEKHQVDVLTAKDVDSVLADWLSYGDNVAVGSVRSSLENNAALLKLVGPQNFYAGVTDKQLEQLHLLSDCYQNQNIRRISLSTVEQCDAVLLIGEDPTHTAPRLALAIRQMTRNAGIDKAANLGILPWQDEAVRNIAQDLRSPLFIVNHHTSRLSDVAQANLNYNPSQQLALLLAVEQHIININFNTGNIGNRAVDNLVLGDEPAAQIANTLCQAQQPAIITGTSGEQPEVLAACLRIAIRLKTANPAAGFYCSTDHANSLALAVLSDRHKALCSLIQRIHDNPPDTLLIMETDLYRYFDRDMLDHALNQVKYIIVLDQLLTRTAKMADLALPTSNFAQSQGCWINSEGRLQKSFAVMPSDKLRQNSFEWFKHHTRFSQHEQILTWCGEQFAPLAPLLGSSFVTATVAKSSAANSQFTVARQSIRASARTAINANTDVKEYPPFKDAVSGLTYSMEGVPSFRQHLVPEIVSPATSQWLPGWNSGQSINKQTTTDKDPLRDGLLLFKQPITNDPIVSIDSLNYSSPIASSGCESHTKNIKVYTLRPKCHIYADDELAAYSTSIQQLIPKPYVWLHPTLANQWQLKDGQQLSLKGRGSHIHLTCMIDPTMATELLLVPKEAFLLLGTEVTAVPDGTLGGEA